MATKLTKTVERETGKVYDGRPVIVTLSPCGSQNEALIRLWHGQKEATAKRRARKKSSPVPDEWRD